MEMALFDWPIVLRYAVKAKVSIDFARLYPFDKPIKSLYFRLFVSVLFARFHFKVIRKSLQDMMWVTLPFPGQGPQGPQTLLQ